MRIFDITGDQETARVIVFEKERCPQCEATLRRFEKRGVRVRVVEAEHFVEAFIALGLSSAPVVFVVDDDGGEVADMWSGFRPEQIDMWAAALTAEGVERGESA